MGINLNIEYHLSFIQLHIYMLFNKWQVSDISNYTSFHPEFTYTFYGIEEQLFGYISPDIQVGLNKIICINDL